MLIASLVLDDYVLVVVYPFLSFHYLDLLLYLKTFFPLYGSSYDDEDDDDTSDDTSDNDSDNDSDDTSDDNSDNSGCQTHY